MDALMVEGIKDRGRWELFHEASQKRMLFGLVQTPEDLAACPQLESRGFYREIQHPVMGQVRLPAVLLNMSATPYQLHRTAPLLGQHKRRGIRRAWPELPRPDPSAPHGRPLMPTPPAPALPLQGIRVVDSSYVFALPYTGGLLADMGAEVIKIEGPARSDITRTGGLYGTFPENEPGGQWWDRSSTYNLINRGKKSLTLDLTTGHGKKLFKELVSISDVVLENYTPRVMRNFGLDYPELRKVRPDIIMASNTGYGHGDGPYSAYPAQATTQEGTHGLCWVTGYVGGPPSKAGASFVDFISTWSAIFAIGAALRHRNLTGEGQWIDMSMYQGGATCISEYLMDWMSNGRIGQRIGNRHPYRAPQGVYPAKCRRPWRRQLGSHLRRRRRPVRLPMPP